MTDIKEAHGLEVVAWQDAENPLYTTGEKRQMHGWATDGYPIVELIRLSDATAVIDQLREQINDPDFPPKYSRRLIAQLRERVAELEESNRSWVLRIQQRGIEMDEMSQLIEAQAAELDAAMGDKHE